MYPLDPLPDADHTDDLEENVCRGNHKSALVHSSQLVHMLHEEVIHGWQLILPKAAAKDIPDGVLTLLGLVKQDLINKFSEIVPKWQLIHDQSFNVIKKTTHSVHDCLC